jgi:hypothetical protein
MFTLSKEINFSSSIPRLKSYCCLAKRQCGGVGGKLETKTQAEQHRRQFDTKLYNCIERDPFLLIPRAFFHSRELLFGSILLHNAVEKRNSSVGTHRFQSQQSVYFAERVIFQLLFLGKERQAFFFLSFFQFSGILQ